MFLVAVMYTSWGNISDLGDLVLGNYEYSKFLLVGELVSATAAFIFVFWGCLWLVRSRLRAFELFRRATIINLYLTQFFEFSREELRAMPGFVAHLILLLLITYVIHQERTLRNSDSDEA